MDAASPSTITVAVLMAVRNRRELTKQCLEYLRLAATDEISLQTYVVDDGSTDQTAQMIRETFPDVRLIGGDGSLYWVGAMRLAEEAALADSPTYVLWLNDDAALVPGAIADLVRVARSTGNRAIVCGAMSDSATGSLTYSGMRARSRYLTAFDLIPVRPDSEAPAQVDSFNGNLVLVPSEISRRLGGLEDRFTHHYGDFDFGLRASAEGIQVLLAPGIKGYTSRNGADGTFQDPKLDRRKRLALLFGAKGYPPREKALYLRRHGPALWPVQFVLVYLGYVVRIAAGK